MYDANSMATEVQIEHHSSTVNSTNEAAEFAESEAKTYWFKKS